MLRAFPAAAAPRRPPATQGRSVLAVGASQRSSLLADVGASPASCATEVSGVKVEDPQPDYDIDNTMANYANSGKGWTGGDGGQSIRLPDGKFVWLEDDVYLGKVVDGSRPNSVFLHNAVVIEDGATFKTLHGPTAKQPTEFMNYVHPPGYWYWNDGAVVSGNTLFVSYSSYYYLGKPSVFGFVRTGTVLVGFSATSLRLLSVTPLSRKQGILWGISMMNAGKYTYIYGTRNQNKGLTEMNYMYVARVPMGRLIGTWQYFNGSHWALEAAKARPVTTEAASEYSVSQLGNAYVLTTMEDSFDSSNLMVYFSCSPTGPFVAGRLVYVTTGHGGVYGTDGIPGVYTYGASAHPELAGRDKVIISYDVNSTDWGILNENVNIVRPRFVVATIKFG
jgi:hypothetical protein